MSWPRFRRCPTEGRLVLWGFAHKRQILFCHHLKEHHAQRSRRYVDGSSFDQTYENVLRHETGHTLALAAFGTAFLIADAIGENVVGSGAEDYADK